MFSALNKRVSRVFMPSLAASPAPKTTATTNNNNNNNNTTATIRETSKMAYVRYNLTASEKLELEKYVRFLALKTSQIICQSRQGDKIETNCVPDASVKNYWVSDNNLFLLLRPIFNRDRMFFWVGKRSFQVQYLCN